MSSTWKKLILYEGGYDLIGRSVDQIRTTEQVNATIATCTDLKLDGLVIIGGKSNPDQFYLLTLNLSVLCLLQPFATI